MSAPERLIAVWEGNHQRTLLVRALPVRIEIGPPGEQIVNALVLLRAEVASAPPDTAPVAARLDGSVSARGSGAAAGYVDLVDACARVARSQGAALQRRLEVRLPSRAVPVAFPEAEIERLLSALLATAAHGFPSGVALHIRIVLDPAELATFIRSGASWSDVAGAVASSQSGARLSGGGSGGSGIRAAVAAVQVTGPRSDARVEQAREALAALQGLAQSLGGAAWVFDDRAREVSYLVRLPVAAL
jgi:hypothetical protein